MRSEPTLEDAARVLDLINGNWTTQVAGVAAELGLADLLLEGPLGAKDLALATGCDTDAMLRLARAMASLGLCTQGEDGRFTLTPAGALLRGGCSPSMHSWALWAALCQWESWGRLLDSVRTGRSARALATGRDGYAHLESDARAAGIFNRAMVELTGFIAGEVAQAYDFSRFQHIVDVGGGHGELVHAILRRYPGSCATIFDLPHARDGACERASASGLGERCKFAAGSFFDSAPRANIYLLKSILHNWDDARAVTILARCRAAIEPGGRVLVIERLMPATITGSEQDRVVIRGDLNMLVGLGGRERTAGEFSELLARAGFGCAKPLPIALGYCLVEAAPR